jgi:hypothetical protein
MNWFLLLCHSGVCSSDARFSLFWFQNFFLPRVLVLRTFVLPGGIVFQIPLSAIWPLELIFQVLVEEALLGGRGRCSRGLADVVYQVVSIS